MKTLKKKEELSDFLMAVDASSEGRLREIMGKEYIDTPGYYIMEQQHYDSVLDFMLSNMGHSELERLIDWKERHPKKARKIISLVFSNRE